MDNALLDEIRQYCERAGISPSTLGVRALGNSRFFDRLQRKADKISEDAERLRKFMENNPPPETAAQQDVA
ncbi:hypothetical protein [Paenirhodobacter sp. CAU 1674]|uniref:hypothetical protein n=1 Tax=Paenirhodobacter sp. CAU 1674 TaxID=3032596 RepID=UPI0023D9DD58|nr:hypothetical protein [Paenirhodobacter sp. CAU 1674]MDF2140837.1 hypothetical protein [Paenirhodobacter sp. CAU 1674]